MLRKFFEGIVFGAGFAISFVVIWYVFAHVATPMILAASVDRAERQFSREMPTAGPEVTRQSSRSKGPEKPFHELGIDEQIAQSSAIALARFEPASDGQKRAIIKEILKQDPGTELYYKAGDEYVPASHFVASGTDYGDGVVIFFTGSPATMTMSMSYSGDRIRGLGDIPIELFKQKCAKPKN
jgi:hypothetical protein